MNNLRSLSRIATLFLIFLSLKTFSQNPPADYHLLFQNEKRWVAENFDDVLKNEISTPEELVNGHVYRILQFFEIPTPVEKTRLELLGIEFLNYLPNRAYLVAFPAEINKENLKNKGIRTILPLDNSMKKGKTLIDIDPNHASYKNGKIDVLLSFYKNLAMDFLENEMRERGFTILKNMVESKSMSVRIAVEEMDDLASLPFVSYLEIMPAPGEPEDRRGQNLHRTNVIDSEYSSGLHYDGEGVGVLVRDDGVVGPHIDFQGRIFQEDLTETSRDHADGVAGIMAGAGNLNPDMRGMAAGADMHVIRYFDDYAENLIALNLHQNEEVLVVNTSYSDGCNAGYTTITETIDRHIYENPTFLHVFSAGNSNNQNCNYGAGNQWGNITGGHKQGKNVIATANLFENQSLVGSSSRGPAHDGRIKPDISANGQEQNSTDFNQGYMSFGGTSGAAPGVAGVSAQLHQAFREFNGGTTASSALIKGTLLNTANDLGNIGPDFKFGWGHLNAYRAFKLLEEGRYEENQISQGENNMHTLNVPSGTAQVRIMIYWNEQAALPNVSKALVNDLDMIVTAPDGTTQMPWVLDATPNATTLDLPATNGEDHLNNVEQVLFDNPAAGNYMIDVSGFEVPFGPQHYFILYEVIPDEIKVTYPIGGEGFEPEVQERIRWDAHGIDGDFVIDYTIDDGATWQNIGSHGGHRRFSSWTPGNEISGQVRVRVSRAGMSDESDVNFSICEIPTNLRVEEFCSDEVMRVAWSPVPSATGYDVFYLGERFMDSVGSTMDTIFDIMISNPLEEQWFSVRAKGANGLRGKRAIAQNFKPELLNCNLSNDVATRQVFSPNVSSYATCDPFQEMITIQIENTSANSQSVISAGYQINNQPAIIENVNVVLAAGETAIHTFTTPIDFPSTGIYELKTWSSVPDDEIIFNDTLFRTINVVLGETVTPTTSSSFAEDFQSDIFPPANWLTSDPQEAYGWQAITGVIGADNRNTTAAMVRNGFNEDVSSRKEFFSVPIDLTNLDNPILIFDVAYSRLFGSCTDTLSVELYSGCNQIFEEEIYKKWGTMLATNTDSLVDWFPLGENFWREESVLLNEYAGDTIQINIVNTNSNCTNLFIDNINVVNYTVPTASFISSATEVCLGEKILFENHSTGVFTSFVWRFGFGTFPPISSEENPDSVLFFSPGEKEIRLIAENPLGADTFYQIINVIDDPEADFDVTQSGDGYQFTNQSEEATSYLWDFGDNTTSTEENPFKVYSQDGNYEVRLTAINQCAEDERVDDLTVGVTTVNNLSNEVQISILPNPNSGNFNLRIEDVKIRNLDIVIYDVHGKILGTWNTQSENGIRFFPINQEDLSGGIYFVKIESEVGVKVLKMTVE